MTDNEPRFLGYRLSAPMFNGASLDQLQSIKADLSRASFHFADDSGGEWGAASKAVASARDKIIDLQLPTMFTSSPTLSKKPQMNSPKRRTFSSSLSQANPLEPEEKAIRPGAIQRRTLLADLDAMRSSFHFTFPARPSRLTKPLGANQ